MGAVDENISIMLRLLTFADFLPPFLTLEVMATDDQMNRNLESNYRFFWVCHCWKCNPPDR